MQNRYSFEIGDLFYAIRRVHGLTQVEFADQLGVVQSTISKIEKGVFDDIPFSLISKLSTSFNIPLAHFQIGLLPLKKSFFYSKDISPEFIKDGVFSAKTVYLILTEIYNSYNPKIYKQLKMQPQYLCFSNLKYNFEFINKLYSLTQEDLFKAIAKIKVYGDQDMNLNNIKKFLQSSYGLNIAANTENHLAKFNFNSTFNELNNVYAKVLEVELKALFGSNVILEKSQENNTYHIHTS